MERQEGKGDAETLNLDEIIFHLPPSPIDIFSPRMCYSIITWRRKMLKMKKKFLLFSERERESECGGSARKEVFLNIS